MIIFLTAIILAVIVWISWPKGNKQRIIQTTETGEIKEVKISVDELYEQAKRHMEDNNLVQVKQLLEQIVNDHPDYENIEQIQKDLENTNMSIVLSNSPSEFAVEHEVVPGDTLGKLAKQYGTTIALIKRKNNLKDNIIRVGQRLRIWNGQFNIHVDKSQNVLLLKLGEDVIKVYSVSTGENNSTPVGSFVVETKLVDPVWFNRGVVVPPESPDNVLGSRWLGWDIEGYGIHGTVSPDQIGQQVTAGCVRMRNADVEELYDIIPYNTQVVVVD